MSTDLGSILKDYFQQRRVRFKAEVIDKATHVVVGNRALLRIAESADPDQLYLVDPNHPHLDQHRITVNAPASYIFNIGELMAATELVDSVSTTKVAMDQISGNLYEVQFVEIKAVPFV